MNLDTTYKEKVIRTFVLEVCVVVLRWYTNFVSQTILGRSVLIVVVDVMFLIARQLSV